MHTGRDLTPLLQTLYAIKQQFGPSDFFRAEADDAHDIAVMQRAGKDVRFVGVFSLKGASSSVPVPLPDGSYENLIDGAVCRVEGGKLSCTGRPVILKTTVPFSPF